MTRYGFAIKALPQGGKPFGEEDDENEDTAGTEEASLETAGPGVSDNDPSEDPAVEDLPEDPTAAPAAPAEDHAAPPATDTPPEGEGVGEDPGAAPELPDDDSRPWAGDMYDEGDETDPENAFAAYTGSDGEQAWLDQAPDGTLTGWVRDSTGQMWRYTDPDAWAIDVDGAQMTRSHGPEGGDGTTDPAAPGGQAPPEDRGVQDPMFASQ
ncbi:hypothetical protein IM697_18225 [Streptomyces ferrugineus]|uniref:Uncharacterized protein n=1 Tax=Streptomyces ferrugineus TaxID=1413221 RepID=A0A7M2SV86_9ACTN|nr:hypothetical protein [Streptomyces ferrugineus]QOV40164.1 hypothetical protein IM697_18225 [Streptomyces ferrugineus]